MIAPNKLIKVDSKRNCDLIDPRLPPSALINPTSLVRSVTATSMMFISPIAAPINVIKPMAPAAAAMVPSRLMNVSAILSLLST